MEIKFFLIIPLLFLVSCVQNNYKIIDVHEHLQFENVSSKFLFAMDRNGIEKTVLLGTPRGTFYLDGSGFREYDANNEEVLNIAKKYPDRFIAFITINPDDPKKLEKLKKYHQEGAKGIKLYSGHSLYYTIPLNDSSLEEIYSYAEQSNIPLLWHVNLFKYEDEFLDVLDKHPRLTVICPHFCLASNYLEKLGELFDTYPSLYTDISFGHDPFMVEGFTRLLEEREKTRDFMIQYRERILYGYDEVITPHPRKTKLRTAQLARCYRDLLEKEKFSCFLFNQTLQGLHLPDSVLRQIYEKNPQNILEIQK